MSLINYCALSDMTYMTHLSDLALPISGTSGPNSRFPIQLMKPWISPWRTSLGNHEVVEIDENVPKGEWSKNDEHLLKSQPLHFWITLITLLEAVACFARIHGEFVVVSMLCPSTTLLHGWGHSTNICQLKWKGCEKDACFSVAISVSTMIHMCIWSSLLIVWCSGVFFSRQSGSNVFSIFFSHLWQTIWLSSLLWRKDWGRIGIFHLCNPWLSWSFQVKPWPLGLTAASWSPWYPQTNHYNDITSMDQHLYKSCIIYHLFGIWPLFGHSLGPFWSPLQSQLAISICLDPASAPRDLEQPNQEQVPPVSWFQGPPTKMAIWL